MAEATVFMFAGFIWWELVIVAMITIGILVSMAEESGLWITGLLVALVFMLTGFNDISIGEMLVRTSIYVALGVAWALFKWRQFVIRETDRYGSNPNNKLEDIIDTINSKRSLDKIYYWIVAWPFSIFGYVFNDMIMELVKKLGKTFDTMTKNIVTNLMK